MPNNTERLLAFFLIFHFSHLRSHQQQQPAAGTSFCLRQQHFAKSFIYMSDIHNPFMTRSFWCYIFKSEMVLIDMSKWVPAATFDWVELLVEIEEIISGLSESFFFIRILIKMPIRHTNFNFVRSPVNSFNLSFTRANGDHHRRRRRDVLYARQRCKSEIYNFRSRQISSSETRWLHVLDIGWWVNLGV